jgi:branched-chain amino acid transport system substrate-binding protein
MNRRTFLASGAAAAAAAATTRSARAQLNQGFQQQLNIGINVPTSGQYAAAGREIIDGVQAAIFETNQYGGTFSSAFAFRIFDDMDALAQSIMNVQFAASDPTVIALVGGVDGPLISAALPTYSNQQMALLVPGSTTDSVTERGYTNVFRLPTKDSTEGQLYAKFVIAREHPKSALAVTQDGDYGYDVAQGFLNQAKASKLDSDAYVFPAEKSDYASAAKRIMTKNPDHIYLCGETGAMGPLIPALRAAGYKGKFGASEGFYNVLTTQKYADDFTGGYISTSFPPLERAPDVANILNDFRSRYPVTSLSAFAYAAAQIIISAVRRTGATNRLATLSALRSPTAYNTLVGQFQFNVTGDSIDPNLYFYTVADGKFKFIAPSHASVFLL